MAKKLKKLILNGESYELSTNNASSSVAWVVKLGSDTQQSVAANSPSSTASRTYPVQVNSSSQMVVNIPWTDTTKTSELNNDAGFITNAVNDLTNYYKKTETYTKSEVNSLVQNFQGFEVVATLPTQDIKTNVIYLKWPIGSGSDKYEEWIYSNSNWVKIWDTSVDLTNYFNKSTDDSDDITEWSTNLFLTSAERTKLGNTSWTNTGDEDTASIKTKLWAASSNADWYLTKEDYADFAWKAETSDIGNATITFKQWISDTAIGSMTANQSSPWTVKIHDNVPVTQSAYDALPSTKATDWNSYWIYETVS